jgi:hypothetical protein
MDVARVVERRVCGWSDVEDAAAEEGHGRAKEWQQSRWGLLCNRGAECKERWAHDASRLNRAMAVMKEKSGRKVLAQ